MVEGPVALFVGNSEMQKCNSAKEIGARTDV